MSFFSVTSLLLKSAMTSCFSLNNDLVVNYKYDLIVVFLTLKNTLTKFTSLIENYTALLYRGLSQSSRSANAIIRQAATVKTTETVIFQADVFLCSKAALNTHSLSIDDIPFFFLLCCVPERLSVCVCVACWHTFYFARLSVYVRAPQSAIKLRPHSASIVRLC